MTVRENLEMGAFTRRDGAAIREDIERVFTLFPRLRERERQKGGTHVGRRAADAGHGPRADGPAKLLLLDEPSLGLAPVIVDKIYEIIREINEQGTTILLVEQNANYALDVSTRGYVLETGTVALSDSSDKLRTDERVRAAYLGLRCTRPSFSQPSEPRRSTSCCSGWPPRSRPVALQAQGLRGEGRPGHGPAAERRRGDHLGADPAQARLALEAAPGARAQRARSGRPEVVTFPAHRASASSSSRWRKA